MTKPKPKTLKILDFSECTDFIEKTYKINTRDFSRSHHVFHEWCKANGEKAVDSRSDIKGSQKQWARFQADIASGKIKERPYQDFWHWLTDVVEVQRGGTLELDADMGEGAEPWQQAILALYLKEFGRGPYQTDW